jgi:hypothetical protein
MLYKQFGIKGEEPKIPRFLKRKLEYLKVAIPHAPPHLARFKSDWMKHRNKISDCSRHRHLFSHSVVLSIWPDQEWVRVFETVFNDHSTEIVERRPKIVRLEKLGHDLSTLCQEVLLFNVGLLTHADLEGAELAP